MKHLNRKKTVLLLAMVVLILAGAVGGTLAYIVTSSGPVQNTFTPAHVTCAVEESDFVDGTSTTKNNVTIRNTGNTSAYIRAAVVGNWVKDGKIVAPWVDNINYSQSGWVKGSDGYYYYKDAVAVGQKTRNLFDSYEPGSAPVADAHLEMTIVCQAIQSEGGAVTVDGNGWTIVNPAPTAGTGN